eukprot:scaffold47378_cov59-Phaeocystis_antarctica.AAC.2
MEAASRALLRSYSRAASATVARASRSRVSCTDPPRQASEQVSQQVSEQARSKQEASKKQASEQVSE